MTPSTGRGSRCGIERGLGLVDWGLSDVDQPGLVAFKRKWATIERKILTLRAGTPAPRPEQVRFRQRAFGTHPAVHRRDGPRRDHHAGGRPALPLLLLKSTANMRGTCMTKTRRSRSSSSARAYVGLPLAMRAIEVGHRVIGFDLDKSRVDRSAVPRASSMTSPTPISEAALASGYCATDDPAELAGFGTAVVCVPTPLRDGAPDLGFIEEAARFLAPHVTRGCCVILESTTYPGTTEEVFEPILEAGRDCGPGGTSTLVTVPSGSTPTTPRSACAIPRR